MEEAVNGLFSPGEGAWAPGAPEAPVLVGQSRSCTSLWALGRVVLLCSRAEIVVRLRGAEGLLLRLPGQARQLRGAGSCCRGKGEA